MLRPLILESGAHPVFGGIGSAGQPSGTPLPRWPARPRPPRQPRLRLRLRAFAAEASARRSAWTARQQPPLFAALTRDLPAGGSRESLARPPHRRRQGQLHVEPAPRLDSSLQSPSPPPTPWCASAARAPAAAAGDVVETLLSARSGEERRLRRIDIRPRIPSPLWRGLRAYSEPLGELRRSWVRVRRSQSARLGIEPIRPLTPLPPSPTRGEGEYVRRPQCRVSLAWM